MRRAIRVEGTVQGVGFRPAVYRLARAARLGGFVRNDEHGVTIEVEGELDAVGGFLDALVREPPPLARIDAVDVWAVDARGERHFSVAPSVPRASGPGSATIPADTATCETCLRELFDPANRRFRHPFVTCTDCGPRYTLVRDLPYDRARTTMASFAMCAACAAEYVDPSDRRYHAEPIACPDCGPVAKLIVGDDETVVGDAAVRCAAALLGHGAILAVKGLGGYQLAVDAHDDVAVRRLRDRKRRSDKPFALMARDLEIARAHVDVTADAIGALLSPAHPIVLVPMRGAPVAASVAPGLRELGVMLPTTPLHHLLLADGPALLVMTSGNVSDEPIATEDGEARRKLAHIADAFLVHDRDIHTRADDSVVRIVAGAPQPVRLARGLAPATVELGVDAPCIVAVGAELKATVCMTRRAQAFLSQHIGDQGTLGARSFFEEVIEKLTRLLGVVPEVVAHDLHPDYASTRWALASGLPAIGVQHHHAHVAACLAEHGRIGPAIGVAFDGTGCGPAGDAWGGEILVFDLQRFSRVGHLRPIALAGGEAAIREPCRLGVAALVDAGEAATRTTRTARNDRAEAVVRMLARGDRVVLATGAGRWFDAIAAILGVRDRISYEGQAAIELEALAATLDDDAYPFELEQRAHDGPFVVDLRPSVRAVAADLRAGESRARIASRFYTTMAEVIVRSCATVRRAQRLAVVALSGGCFQSTLLTERAKVRLEAAGFEVLVHRRVPPNDGGIAFGQAAVAAHRLARGREDPARRIDACA